MEQNLEMSASWAGRAGLRLCWARGREAGRRAEGGRRPSGGWAAAYGGRDLGCTLLCQPGEEKGLGWAGPLVVK